MSLQLLSFIELQVIFGGEPLYISVYFPNFSEALVDTIKGCIDELAVLFESEDEFERGYAEVASLQLSHVVRALSEIPDHSDF